MHITTHNKRVNSSNVFGYIKGSVEPGSQLIEKKTYYYISTRSISKIYMCNLPEEKSWFPLITFFVDRYILMGNHRDAWYFGAVDPTGGTAVMMEISRVFASLVKQGLFFKSVLTLPIKKQYV